jgi:hypothetical protein
VTCEERRAVARDDARGWRAFRSDLPPEAELEDLSTAEVPAVVYDCPTCAAPQFGSA